MDYNMLSEGSEKIDEKPAKKLRQNLPIETKDGLWKWFTSNLSDPYPDEETKQMFCSRYNLVLSQVNNWFINTRRRYLGKIFRKHGLKQKNDENMNGCPDENIKKNRKHSANKNGWYNEKIEILRSRFPDTEKDLLLDKMNGGPDVKKNGMRKRKRNGSNKRHGAYSSSSGMSMLGEGNKVSDTSSASNRSSSPCEAQIFENILQSQFPFANNSALLKLASVSLVKGEIEKLSI